MDKYCKLNFRFHDPNEPLALASALMHICIEANTPKVERILQGETEKEKDMGEDKFAELPSDIKSTGIEETINVNGEPDKYINRKLADLAE